MTRLAILLVLGLGVTVVAAGPIINQVAESAANKEKRQAPEEGANGKVAAPAADTSPAPANGNVYGQNLQNDQAAGKPVERGYNQGYSYNTGVKPYTRGYTYYQPFGDAVNEENPNNNNSQGAAPAVGTPGRPALPVNFPGMFGGNQKFGPVKAVPNQNMQNFPIDENGIPNLDALDIPNAPPPGAAVTPIGRGGQAAQPAQPPVEIPVNPNEFQMPADFNLEGLVPGMAQPTTRRPSIFDFAPPSSNNFDFDQAEGGQDRTDYNNLDNFAGNLNNFDNYLGGPSNRAGGGNNGGGNNGGGNGFNFGGQQVPSEIVNLNNAFGSGGQGEGSGNGGSGASGGNMQAAPGSQEMSDIFNSLGGSSGGNRGGGNQAGGMPMDIGSFGSPSNNNQKNQPNNFFATFL